MIFGRKKRSSRVEDDSAETSLEGLVIRRRGTFSAAPKSMDAALLAQAKPSDEASDDADDVDEVEDDDLAEDQDPADADTDDSADEVADSALDDDDEADVDVEDVDVEDDEGDDVGDDDPSDDDEDDSEDDAEGSAAEASDDDDPRADGPFDASEVDLGLDDPDDVSRFSLGPITITPFPEMGLEFFGNQETNEIYSMGVSYGQSGLQVELFAAPASGLAEELFEDIVEETQQAGGNAVIEAGPFGKEIRRTMPVEGPEGEQLFQVARVWLVDGPRWLLRGSLVGQAGFVHGEEPPSDVFVEFFRNIVVHRDDSPRFPGELLLLTLPQTED